MTGKQIFPSFIQDHPSATLCFDKKTQRILAGNKAAAKLLGYTTTGLTKLKLSDLFQHDRSVKGNKSFTGSLVTKAGATLPAKGHLKTISERGNKLNLIIFQDVIPVNAPAKEKEELDERHRRMDKIVQVSHNEIYVVNDKSLGVEYANMAALKNLGYREHELATLKLTDLFSFPDELGLHALLNSLRRGETDRLQLQLRFGRRNSTSYDADVLIQVLEKDRLFLLLVTDITAKLVTERKLRDTIHEKETLIKEIHHRVKNNLQLISSIIYLKLASVVQPDIRNFLDDTRQKIRSIALIHERLLQTEKLDKVDLSDYLGKLIHDLKVTYYKQDLALEFRTDIQEKMIGLDTAIICGLIVNELVTNAIKHAFAGHATGLIEIIFSEDAQGKFLLEVSDNGVSLPAHITPGDTSSFGMQLVDVFVKQLGGSYEIIREKGTTFRIQF